MLELLGVMLTSVSDPALEPLRRKATVVADLERTLAAARSDRDEEIKRVCGLGRSTRDAAAAANVSPSYAHRAAKNGRFARAVRAQPPSQK
jgi:hypothetical protein